MKPLFLIPSLFAYSLVFASNHDITGSYRCLQQSRLTHQAHEFIVFVKPTNKTNHYQILFEIPDLGKFKGTACVSQNPDYYFVHWETESNPNMSGMARWKILPHQDGAIKSYYLGFDKQTQLIHEGKMRCKPIYD